MIINELFEFQMPSIEAGTGTEPIDYSVPSPLPPGVMMDANGFLTATPTVLQDRTMYLLRATDSQGPVQRTADLPFHIVVEQATPAAVGGLATSMITATSVRITWTAPVGDVDVDGYKYTITGRAGIFNVAAGTLMVDITGLEAETEYTVTVWAFNGSGDGTTDDVTFTTAEAPPGPVIGFNVTVAIFGDNETYSLAFAWLPPTEGGSVTGYWVDGIPDRNPIFVLPGATSTQQGVRGNNIYTFTAWATGPGGDGPVSTFVLDLRGEVQGVPDVAGVDAQMITATSTRIIWGFSDDGDYDGIVLSGIGADRIVTDDTVTHYDYTGLTPGTTYTVTVWAYLGDTDDNGGSDSETFTTLAGLEAPSFDETTRSHTVQQGQSLTVPADTAGGNPEPIYSLIGAPDWASYNDTLREFTFAPATSVAATAYPFTFRATNSEGTSDQTITVTVSTEDVPVDLMPSFIPSSAELDAEFGDTVQYTFPAAIGGDTPLTYAVSSGLSWFVVQQGNTYAGTVPTTQGDQTYTVTWTATDNDGDTADFTLTINASAPPVDLMPSFPTVGLDLETNSGDTVSYTFQRNATGGDPPLTYGVVSGPSWFTIQQGDTYSGTAPQIVGFQQYPVVWRVTDTDGDTADFTLNINVTGSDIVPDPMPSFSPSSAAISVQQGQTAQYTFPTSTGGDAPVTHALHSGPSWFVVQQGNTYAGTVPTTQGEQNYIVTWRATDADGDTADFTLTITGTVAPIDSMPSFSPSSASISVQQGQTAQYTFQRNATGGDAPLTYAVSSGLSWFTVQQGDTYAGTVPTTQGDQTYTVVWTVTDADNDTADFTLTITGTVAPVDSMPSFNPTSEEISVQQGQTAQYTFQRNAIGGDAPLTYAVVTAPSWFTVQQGDTYAGVVPTTQGDQTYTVTWRVTDNDNDTADFTLRIIGTVDSAPSFDPSSGTADATGGVAFDYTFPTATGGDGTLTYSIINRPSWLTSLSEFVYSGTPPIQQGTQTVTITWRATDADNDTADFTLTITISTPVTQLGAPVWLSPPQTDRTTSSVEVSWSAVTNASGYEAEWLSPGGWTDSGVVVDGTKATISSLSINSTISVRVMATSTSALYSDSEWSTTIMASTTLQAHPPTNLATVVTGFGANTIINVSWDHPADTTGLAGYRLERKTSAQIWSQALVTNVQPATSLVQQRISASPGTTFNYRLRSTGSAGYVDSDFITADVTL